LFRLRHLGDTCVLVPPEGLADRLTRVGFTDVTVETGSGMVRFQAHRPE
jgi:hypothetical protein